MAHIQSRAGAIAFRGIRCAITVMALVLLSAPTLSIRELQDLEIVDVDRVQATAERLRSTDEVRALESRTRRELSTAARGVTSASGSLAARVADLGIDLNPGDAVAVRRRDQQSIGCTDAGSGWCMRTEVGFIALNQNSEQLNLVLDVETSGPMRFDRAAQQFVAELLLKLTDQNSEQQRPIGRTVQIALLSALNIEGNGTFNFERSNTFQRARLTAMEPSNPSLIQLRASSRIPPAEVKLPVTEAQLVISTKPGIHGLGLEKTPVTVQLTGGPYADRQVILSARDGIFDDTNLPFGPDGIATTSLRSKGIGVDTITAKSRQLEATPVSIEYEVPWSWFAAVLIGGFAGFLGLRRLWGNTSGHLLRDLLYAVVAGAVTAGLFALGVNISGFGLPAGFSELSAFILSALGGAVLPRALTRGDADKDAEEEPNEEPGNDNDPGPR